VTPRARVVLLVAAAASAAAAVTVGAVLLQSGGDETDAAPGQPPAGAPPLLLDLGVRDDEEARALRKAEGLWGEGDRAGARALLARYDSLDAQVGAALARWPNGAVPALEALARRHPDRAVVRLNLGFALFWAGRRDEAAAAWRETRRIEPDSMLAVRAGDLLFPNFARGMPVVVLSFEPPDALDRLTPAQQLDRLRSDAVRGGAREKLLFGVALQRLGRQLSARAQYDRAAALAPRDAEAQVAAAVGRFDKERPDAAFSRLGPLARRFPGEPTVRFHLGLLLLWMGDVEDARRQLTLARTADPADPLAREAARFLERLAG